MWPLIVDKCGTTSLGKTKKRSHELPSWNEEKKKGLSKDEGCLVSDISPSSSCYELWLLGLILL